MLKRNVQNLNKEYLLICIVKVGVHACALSAPSPPSGFVLFDEQQSLQSGAPWRWVQGE